MTTAFHSEPLHEKAVAAIREMIISGRLAPNARISEKALCDAFGISRTPLREALKVLASEGLISLLPRRGAQVTSISPQDTREKFEVVRLIEGEAARLVCELATEAQLTRLSALHAKLKSAHARHLPRDYFALNEQFHRTMVEIAGNATLVDIHASLVDHLRRARYSTMLIQDMDPRFVDEHDLICQALLSRDPDRAEAAVKAHQASVESSVVHGLG
jgi:DNA-binding GntR family transcriptional regulator